jgi:hypothetical protein
VVPRYIYVIEALLRTPCINIISLEGHCSMVSFVVRLQLVISGHFIGSPDVASRPVPGPEGYNSDDIMKNIKSYPL